MKADEESKCLLGYRAGLNAVYTLSQKKIINAGRGYYGGMAQCITMLAAKLENLFDSPGPTWWKRRTDLHICTIDYEHCIPKHTQYMNKCNKNIYFKKSVFTPYTYVV